jgi:hypothetical protein
VPIIATPGQFSAFEKDEPSGMEAVLAGFLKQLPQALTEARKLKRYDEQQNLEQDRWNKINARQDRQESRADDALKLQEKRYGAMDEHYQRMDQRYQRQEEDAQTFANAAPLLGGRMDVSGRDQRLDAYKRTQAGEVVPKMSGDPRSMFMQRIAQVGTQFHNPTIARQFVTTAIKGYDETEKELEEQEASDELAGMLSEGMANETILNDPVASKQMELAQQVHASGGKASAVLPLLKSSYANAGKRVGALKNAGEYTSLFDTSKTRQSSIADAAEQSGDFEMANAIRERVRQAEEEFGAATIEPLKAGGAFNRAMEILHPWQSRQAPSQAQDKPVRGTVGGAPDVDITELSRGGDTAQMSEQSKAQLPPLARPHAPGPGADPRQEHRPRRARGSLPARRRRGRDPAGDVRPGRRRSARRTGACG